MRLRLPLPRVALRLFALLLIVAGLLVQPVLGSMGALHEIAEHHAVEGAHDEDGRLAANLVGDGQPAPPADPLHLLVHYAHCCGQASALFVALMAIPHPAGPRDVRTVADVHAVAHTYLRGPFRPPITA